MKTTEKLKEYIIELLLSHNCKKAARIVETIECNDTESRKLFGWVILDKDGVSANFVPVQYHFYGTILNSKKPDKEYLDRLDRDWAGLAPHSIKELFVD